MNTLFRTILNMSLSGAFVIVAVMAARLLLRRAPKKWSYLLWSAAAFRLVCPVSLRSEFSLFRLLPEAGRVTAERGGFVSALEAIPSAQRMETGVAAAREAILSAPAAGAASGQAVSSLGEATQSALSGGLSGAAPAVSAAPAAPLPAAAPVDWLTVLGWVWLCVAACLLLFGAVNYLLTKKRLAAAIRLEGRVYQSELVSSPFILGLLRPRIYIPYGLEGERLDYALAHEKRHLRRGDPWFKLLAWLLLCLHWFNPLVWPAFFLMGRDMEMSCDEAVLASGGDLRQGYSQTLLSFAVKQGFPRPNPLCFGETGVKSRIRNALRWKQAGGWITLGALVLCLLLIAGCALNPPEAEKTDESLTLNADGTLGLLRWGMTPNEAMTADSRIFFDSGTGGELFETWTQKELSLFGEKMCANYLFVTHEGNTFLDAMELCFTGPFDKAAVVSQLEGLWGPRIDHYTSLSGQELPAPEENWWWELDGGVRAQFAVSDGLPALCIDATALNARAGRYGELTGRERALDYSEEQLERINEELAPFIYDENGGIVSASPVSCFFTSFYEDVRDLDLEQFLRYFPISEEVTEPEELAAVAAMEEERFGTATGGPTHRIRVADVDEVLLEYAGIKVDELNTDWRNTLSYLPETDAFYTHSSDFGAGTFRVDGGSILMDTGEEWLWSTPPGEDGTALLLKRQYVPYHYLITAFTRVPVGSVG